MLFKIGDWVVLPAYGIGQLIKIEEKNVSEQGTRLYYKITLSKRTIWIPVEAHEISGLRLAIVKAELDHYRDVLKSPATPMETNYRRRYVELITRLKQGSFQIICEVVRDLTAWDWHKPLGRTESTLLQETRQSLYQEWATAAGISNLEAIKEIDSLLLATQ